MSEKVVAMITVVAVFVLLSNVMLETKQGEFEYAVEKNDFILADLKHGTRISGGWGAKGYMITIQISSLHSKLDMKLVLKDRKGFGGNVDMEPDNYHKPEQEKTHKLQTCAVNGTRPVSNRTCKPRPLGFMMRLCNICQAITVTMRHWAKDGATWVWNGFVNATTTMTDKGYCGMMFVSSWTWERMIWLINETRETVTWIAERALERIQQIVIRLGLWAWDGLAWLAEMIWWGASRLAAGLWDVGAWLGNCIAEIYAGYLESHVTYVIAWFARLTLEDVTCFLIVVTVVTFAVKLIKRAVKVIRQRRLERQAQLAAEAAAAAAAAARKRKRAAIQNLKNRHKKKQF